MEMYDVGRNGISGFVAQVDTPITLDSWFESNAERTYVVKFSDYCEYLATYGRDGYNSLLYSQSYKLMQKLQAGKLDMKKQEAEDIITLSYCTYIHDVGIMLLKEAGLYSRNDSDWTPFDIAVSLPVALKDALGYTSVPAILDSVEYTGFVEVLLDTDFDSVILNPILLDELINREDISLQDILNTRGTPLEQLVLKGMQYLTLSRKSIKGRVVQNE